MFQPNGAILNQFVHDRKFDDYCSAMAKDGCWGDHLTLIAISEMFGVQISIFSSVEGDNFITEIHPTTKKVRCSLVFVRRKLWRNIHQKKRSSTKARIFDF